MSNESNADVYASFGVNSAVMTGSTVEEHEQNMLALDVAARDGDDAIELEVPQVDDPYGNPDPFAEGEDEEGRIQVRIGEDHSSHELEVDADDGEGDEADDPENPDGEPEAFEPIGETPKDIESASEQLAEHEAGFNDMIATAMERGLASESITRIQGEYSADEGLSEESYAELAEAGYSKAFVDAYIRGQEALVNQYVDQVMEFVGGRERFQSVYGHLQTNDPSAAESLIKAFEARDVGTMKTILNLAGQSRVKTFGKKAERTLTKKATQAKPVVSKKSEGFASRDEMIKAMSDSRYRTDSQYRRSVEQKVIDSKF